MLNKVTKLDYCNTCGTKYTCEQVEGPNGGIYHGVYPIAKKQVEGLADYLGCNRDELTSAIYELIDKFLDEAIKNKSLYHRGKNYIIAPHEGIKQTIYPIKQGCSKVEITTNKLGITRVRSLQ